jgi:soluble lytic murein transglycosylase-like protein
MYPDALPRSAVRPARVGRLAAAAGHVGLDPAPAGADAQRRRALCRAARRHHHDAPAPIRSSWPPAGRRCQPTCLRIIFPLDYWPLITKYSSEHKLDPYLIAALMAQESTFTAEIRSHANAYGLMQIIRTRAALRTQDGHQAVQHCDAAQAEINVQHRHAVLPRPDRQIRRRAFALASYNAGESRVDRWTDERPGIPQDEFIDDIPFPETQTYVKRILGTAEDYRYL